MKLVFIVCCLFFLSCSSDKNESTNSHVEKVVVEEIEDSVQVENTLVEDYVEQEGGVIVAEVRVIDVREELIMPSDYLTTVITVVTDSQDTLSFMNINEEEVSIGQNIAIKYEMKNEYRMLVCFECESYSKEIELYDITSKASEVTFEKLKLIKYIPDEYIIPASKYLMELENGELEEFHSLEAVIINDSIKMSSGFYTYGVITKSYPELISIQ